MNTGASECNKMGLKKKASQCNKIDFGPKLPIECANSRPIPEEGIRGVEKKDSHPQSAI